MEQITRKHVCPMATFYYANFTRVGLTCDYCNVKKKSNFLHMQCQHEPMEDHPSHHLFLDFCEKCCSHYGYITSAMTLHDAFKNAERECLL